MISSQQAVARLKAEFPFIRESLSEDDGLIHLQLATWSDYARTAIEGADRAKFAHICGVFCDLFSDAADDLKNALNVSFLEHLNFNDNQKHSWAYQAMPPKMKVAWDEMQAYIEKLERPD